jgi:hypothetical protein
MVEENRHESLRGTGEAPRKCGRGPYSRGSSLTGVVRQDESFIVDWICELAAAPQGAEMKGGGTAVSFGVIGRDAAVSRSHVPQQQMDCDPAGRVF